jgi:hypothetical protein
MRPFDFDWRVCHCMCQCHACLGCSICSVPYAGILNKLWGLGPSRVIVPARQATKVGGISSLESIPGLHKSLKFGLSLPRYLASPVLSAKILFVYTCLLVLPVHFFPWLLFGSYSRGARGQIQSPLLRDKVDSGLRLNSTLA